MINIDWPTSNAIHLVLESDLPCFLNYNVFSMVYHLQQPSSWKKGTSKLYFPFYWVKAIAI